MLKNQIEKLYNEKSNPSVSISLNTHKTFPENQKDDIVLKNLCKEAEDRLLNEFEKRSILPILEKLEQVQNEIDHNYNLKSLHVFISKDRKEIIKSMWSVNEDSVSIANHFNLTALIKEYNRSKEYLLLVLSQSGTNLHHCSNNSIVSEIKNENFPFKDNPHYITHADKGSDAKAVDNQIKEYFNKIDKAVVKVANETGLPVVVTSTKDNYTKMIEMADVPQIYLGHTAINYNDLSEKTLTDDAWEFISEFLKEERTDAINELKQAVSNGLVLTDVQEIFRAVQEGRGELLISKLDYNQAALKKDEFTIELINDVRIPNAIDDITSDIAWNVIAKKGRAVFTSQDEMNEIGDIALKVRY